MAQSYRWESNWNCFKEDLPHQKVPVFKKELGNNNHSLCSYQGKLKPAIGYHLVKTFVPAGGNCLTHSQVGTIPFEGALNGIVSYGMDISKMCYYISQAKIGETDKALAEQCIERLDDYIRTHCVTIEEFAKYSRFGLNKRLIDYYEETTFKEILLARKIFIDNKPVNASEMVVISSLLHILHGNRPYALSRKSHSITPYAPSGEFEYRNLICRLAAKVDKYFSQKLPETFISGQIYLQDSTLSWPDEIQDIDAIITSPPF